MKYIAGGIVAAAAVIGIALWLRGAPEANMKNQPQTPPSVAGPSSAPAEVANQAGSTSSSGSEQAPITKPTILKTKTINGMKIETTKEGTGEAITNGKTAMMLYTGKLVDGTIFDSTSKRGNEPFSFVLGAGQVIKGWDQGVLGMKVGEERTLTIPADLGYGAGGYPGVIPPNATLVFDVTLVGIK